MAARRPPVSRCSPSTTGCETITMLRCRSSASMGFPQRFTQRSASSVAAARGSAHRGMMPASQLRPLVAEGWELGAHTMTHPDLSTLDYAACRAEIEQSRTVLEEIGQAPVETFAYPFGRYGPEALDAVRDVGFL